MSDSILIQKLATGDTRRRVIQDCVRLIDQEVASKRGLRAAPVKAGFKALKGLKPGFVAEAVDALLDDFCRALDPFYERWAAEPPGSRPPLAAELQRQEDSVSDALLGVTDARAQRAKNRTVLKLYNRLRGMAQTHVKAALPGLGRTIEPHLGEG